MESKTGQLQVIDIPALVSACTEKWMNMAVSQVNDAVIRLGVIEGEFHWHKHDREDEFFFVVSGKLFIDLEDRTVVLLPQQGYTVPLGVLHRTRAPERTVILMVEKNTVDPKGDE
ncbi:cupin domain-containing protein [Heliomicrobium modesticaldum]|uniref:cupin domain-containing protein n=1 Tax=Heliomicrobium modesticaldum TaxID=35701 RepID=UPI00059D4268|nr:cupin domain-containing protein [Heliomicrobium modesticaldum]